MSEYSVIQTLPEILRETPIFARAIAGYRPKYLSASRCGYRWDEARCACGAPKCPETHRTYWKTSNLIQMAKRLSKRRADAFIHMRSSRPRLRLSRQLFSNIFPVHEREAKSISPSVIKPPPAGN
jgi:hypothetical protein